MTTERSDKLRTTWRDSTEKFDYFILGVTGALCAFISQTYKPAKIGVNAGTLEVVALLILVLAVVASFRRLEKSLLTTATNHQELHAYEARGVYRARVRGLFIAGCANVATRRAARCRVCNYRFCAPSIAVGHHPIRCPFPS